MPLLLFHTARVRDALKTPARFGLDALLLGCVGAVFGIMIMIGRQATAPLVEKTVISLSFWSLPKYTLLSLARGFAAYVVSLAFTLVYGTIAAHNRRAEKIMLPALDILQAIPVLGFLPGLVLMMVQIFPTREIGLELACILMIFTGQAWNMTFSFHGSLRSIPATLREVAAMNQLTGWQIFKILEVPASMIGLVWNSMMSMAGGWFFISVNEAFTLGNHDYRLPGIGSYMSEAIHQLNYPAMIAAVLAMTLMIVIVDQFFWRPIVVWSQKFKLEDSNDAEKPSSWVLHLLKKSNVYGMVLRGVDRLFHRRALAAPRVRVQRISPAIMNVVSQVVRAIALLLVFAIAAWGTWELMLLLAAATREGDWLRVFGALGASFARTSAAVAIGAAVMLPVGILIGLSPKWSNRLQPIIQTAASFPAPMLFPLVTLALHALHVPFTIGCVALMLLGAQWYILFNVIAGASAIPADLKEVAQVYRFTPKQRWTKIYLPCTFPYLVTGLVTAAGGAWNATIVSEYVQIGNKNFMAFGLGSLISTATEQKNFPLLTASVVAMALFVVMLNRILWKRLYRLAEHRYSLNA